MPSTIVQRVPHHTIERMSVTGGFLKGVELDFADGLNCLIGGRGAGKTTALEFLRYALGLMPDSKTQTRRFRNIEGLVKSNLGHGRLKVQVRTKAGMSYSAGRGFGEDVQVLDEVGNAVPVSLENDLIFGADVFSQNEIEEIATDPLAQLALLDRFEEDEMVKVRRAIDGLSRELRESESVLLRLDEQIEDLTAKASEVPALEERLKAFAEVKGPNAEKLNDAHSRQLARRREAQPCPTLTTALRTATTQAAAAAEGFRTSAAGQIGDTPSGPNAEVLSLIEAEAARFQRVLDTCVAEIQAEADRVAANLDGHRRRLAELHAAQEAEYRQLIETAEERGGKMAARNELQTALADAQAKAKERDAKIEQRSEAIDDRQDLLDRLSELRDQRFVLRKRVASMLTSKALNIRVSVAQAADMEEYKQLVAEALRGAGVKRGMVADQLVNEFLPSELSLLASSDDTQPLEQRLGYDFDRARRILSGLRSSRQLYELETVDLEDVPSIELLDGNTYKKSSQLSTGQRCTTILPILLLQSERPLLVDQPEDNLDNAFVYETVVSALEEVRGSRQVIFVTHNPNIPVLGAADRVFVFESDGQQAAVPNAGSVDDCKADIERILEGGKEAFLKRWERYGY